MRKAIRQQRGIFLVQKPIGSLNATSLLNVRRYWLSDGYVERADPDKIHARLSTEICVRWEYKYRNRDSDGLSSDVCSRSHIFTATNLGLNAYPARFHDISKGRSGKTRK